MRDLPHSEARSSRGDIAAKCWRRSEIDLLRVVVRIGRDIVQRSLVPGSALRV